MKQFQLQVRHPRLRSSLLTGLLAGYLGLAGCGGGGGSVAPSPPPIQPRLSQTVSLVRDVDINYEARLTNVSQATRTITRNGAQYGTPTTITTSPYTETFDDVQKGNYSFRLEASGVTPHTASLEVPNYTPTSNFSSLDTSLNERYEGSSKTFNLESLLSDRNPEDNPVPLNSAASLDGNTAVSISGHELTISAIGAPGPYEVEINFGSTEGGVQTATLAGEILAVPDQITFFSDRDHGAGELYIANIENGALTNVLRLTNNRFNDAMPAFSPDGSKLAFVSNRDLGRLGIWVMSNLDGSDQATKITPDDMGAITPTWCSDGRIYFGFSDNLGRTGIARIKPDRTGLEILVDEPFLGTFVAEPTCSSDSTTIAFESSQSGSSEVYVINADGTNRINLTNNLTYDGQPRISSNGEIAFASDRDGGTVNIHVMDSDGSNVRRLTTGGSNFDPNWSPDGDRIVFTRDFQIWLMNKDGTSLFQLTTTDQNRRPACRPHP